MITILLCILLYVQSEQKYLTILLKYLTIFRHMQLKVALLSPPTPQESMSFASTLTHLLGSTLDNWWVFILGSLANLTQYIIFLLKKINYLNNLLPNVSMQRVHLDINVGEHAVDYQQVQAKDKLTELQLRVRQLLDQVEQITKEQNYQRVSTHLVLLFYPVSPLLSWFVID